MRECAREWLVRVDGCVLVSIMCVCERERERVMDGNMEWGWMMEEGRGTEDVV